MYVNSRLMHNLDGLHHFYGEPILMPSGFKYVVQVYIFPTDPQKDRTFRAKLHPPNPTIMGQSDYNLQRVDPDVLVPDMDTNPYEKFSKISIQRYVDFGVIDSISLEVPALLPIKLTFIER